MGGFDITKFIPSANEAERWTHFCCKKPVVCGKRPSSSPHTSDLDSRSGSTSDSESDIDIDSDRESNPPSPKKQKLADEPKDKNVIPTTQPPSPVVLVQPVYESTVSREKSVNATPASTGAVTKTTTNEQSKDKTEDIITTRAEEQAEASTSKNTHEMPEVSLATQHTDDFALTQRVLSHYEKTLELLKMRECAQQNDKACGDLSSTSSAHSPQQASQPLKTVGTGVETEVRGEKSDQVHTEHSDDPIAERSGTSSSAEVCAPDSSVLARIRAIVSANPSACGVSPLVDLENLLRAIRPARAWNAPDGIPRTDCTTRIKPFVPSVSNTPPNHTVPLRLMKRQANPVMEDFFWNDPSWSPLQKYNLYAAGVIPRPDAINKPPQVGNVETEFEAAMQIFPGSVADECAGAPV